MLKHKTKTQLEKTKGEGAKPHLTHHTSTYNLIPSPTVPAQVEGGRQYQEKALLGRQVIGQVWPWARLATGSGFTIGCKQ